MKHLPKLSLMALLFSAVSASPLLADTIVPGGGISPLPVTTAPTLTGVVTMAPQSFSFGGSSGNKDQGTFVASVGESATNPFGVDDLTFEYQFHVTKGDVSSITVSDFTGFKTDVAIALGSLPHTTAGTPIKPFSVNRSGISGPDDGANIQFVFDPDALPGATTYILIVNTNATDYNINTIGLRDSGAESLFAYEPIGSPFNPNLTSAPEPSSLLLLGTGLLGVGMVFRRRFSF